MTFPDTLRPPALLIARWLMAAIFLHEGVAKLQDMAATTAYMQAFGVPSQLLPLTILLELGGGILLVLGPGTRIVSVLFAAFCILTAALFHTKLGDRNQLLHFEKDFAMAGGFLALAVAGPGPWSIARLFGRRPSSGG